MLRQTLDVIENQKSALRLLGSLFEFAVSSKHPDILGNDIGREHYTEGVVEDGRGFVLVADTVKDVVGLDGVTLI
ncbi:uncharacterized protein A4U43_C03F14750 [Asparagus officinalis]|uniref:Uncharacterized protein n=1 Tax=Asparagus officinalis TaxID=4686 RepID=A0A5P1FB04_ASPOF|nr:uncharacterized protein A4U43_C03F14750 [Asparagus officinalis]